MKLKNNVVIESLFFLISNLCLLKLLVFWGFLIVLVKSCDYKWKYVFGL